MEISQNMPAALTAGPAQYTQATKNGDAVISSDFETFLKMLTAQMENQDPLNPIESSDYAVQLATFSGVEQQVRTNDLLDGLGTKLGLMGLSDIAGWVGMEARVAAPVLFDQSPVTLVPQPANGADETRLVVKNAAGDVMENRVIPMTTDPVEWAGVDQSGAPLPRGVYTFELTSLGNGRHLSTDPVQAYSKITETQNSDGKLWLILESGQKIQAETVSAIREP
ncbi:flagellar hook assembly protein FlgD [Aliiroseovarius sp. S1339]|uniref:flagellar hook capping FlgD N-terminal domain-containing protein n=1 Tax=Aliiroseovarius sp. S1339 TaxID=2936990 RepID=UPI0020C01762|nr:flagellar hook capping FlgD N-terminal domain-containing protein [Aliiroseovarius sp. S1339]MCK8463348.1 flagellar hook assembly protein FlgD [Aliiroseovarius sp. S1339]